MNRGFCKKVLKIRFWCFRTLTLSLVDNAWCFPEQFYTCWLRFTPYYLCITNENTIRSHYLEALAFFSFVDVVEDAVIWNQESLTLEWTNCKDTKKINILIYQSNSCNTCTHKIYLYLKKKTTLCVENVQQNITISDKHNQFIGQKNTLRLTNFRSTHNYRDWVRSRQYQCPAWWVGKVHSFILFSLARQEIVLHEVITQTTYLLPSN